MELNSSKLDMLIQEVEKIRRRKIIDFSNEGDIKYIDPYDNLSKFQINNNHLILGRRGTGKTTFLLSNIKGIKNNFVIPRDCQIFRNWNSYRIVEEILLDTIGKILEYLYESEFYLDIVTKKESLKFVFFKKNKKAKINKEYFQVINLILQLKELFEILKKIQIMPEKSIIKRNTIKKEKEKITKLSKRELKIKNEMSSKGKLSSTYLSFSTRLDFIASLDFSQMKDVSNETEVQETSDEEIVVTKLEELEKIKLFIAETFSDFTQITKNKIVLYLDDFYFIKIETQPYIAQYFHDIYKNSRFSAFCFKLCSIPNRIKINVDDSVDFSYKDDFSPIKLDKELYELNNLKQYLLQIAISVYPGTDLHIQDLESLFSNDEVLIFSIIATGGVPRDFLITLVDLIKYARTDNSNSIKKEHLYSIISNLREDKENNIEVDTDISPIIIREAKTLIEDEIIRKENTNVILYPNDKVKEHEKLLKNLVNLRYLHIINENTTSEKKKKETFTSYLIDMTFYATGKKLKPGFDFNRFWEKDIESRHTSLRNAFIWSFPEEIINKL